MKEKIRLSGVPETMLQTVYARAKESRGARRDSRCKSGRNHRETGLRFFPCRQGHSHAQRRHCPHHRAGPADKSVAWGAPRLGGGNIACGLDTRCYRMSGYAHWYNLDLPETMAVREKLLPESGTISQIAMSAMEDWGSKISEQNVPVLIVIEGLTMYLNAKDVQQIFAVISSRFSQATIFVETMNPAMVRHFKEKSIDASNAKFTWGIKNGKALAELLPGFRFMEEHSLTEGMAVFAPIYKLLDKLPTVRNIFNKIIVLEKEL